MVAANPYGALGSYGSPNPYYQQNNPYYGSWGLSFPRTPVADLYLNSTPQAAYTRFTAPWAGGLDPYSQFVQGQYSNLRDAYSAAVATNPDLTWTRYLGGIPPSTFARQWQMLGPHGRGDQWSTYAPRTNWIRWG